MQEDMCQKNYMHYS